MITKKNIYIIHNGDSNMRTRVNVELKIDLPFLDINGKSGTFTVDGIGNSVDERTLPISPALYPHMPAIWDVDPVTMEPINNGRYTILACLPSIVSSSIMVLVYDNVFLQLFLLPDISTYSGGAHSYLRGGITVEGYSVGGGSLSNTSAMIKNFLKSTPEQEDRFHYLSPPTLPDTASLVFVDIPGNTNSVFDVTGHVFANGVYGESSRLGSIQFINLGASFPMFGHNIPFRKIVMNGPRSYVGYPYSSGRSDNLLLHVGW